MSKGVPIAVAGTGVISAIGNNTGECLRALGLGQAGMGDIRWLETVHRGHIPVAEVKAGNTQLGDLAGVREPMSRTALLSLIAAREALASAAIPEPDRWRTGIVSANTVGGMDRTEGWFAAGMRGRLREIVQHECGYHTEWVAGRLGIRHYQTTISTACSSSANSIGFAARLIRHGILDVVVAGGADALTKFTLNGFHSLMILDRAWCRPFDNERQGLNLGEGAGYVVLVSDAVAATLPRGIDCVLSGYANANDAYHQTASSPEGRGSWLAMSTALQRSGLQPADIDYINLHGTGTQNNDLAEGTAIRRLFDPRYPRMSSTKSFTGHTLGASGGIEAVFSVLAIRDGVIYPNLRFQTPMSELPFAPETEFLRDVPVRHVLSNSFGFGGNCSSLVFSKSQP
ncbi:MAG TPA: beta-ketoacyl-[acyl-carrier-protein] synthase family protein [Puia sp.]|nr:beta-ketoacyl-[acyl-carrier-protein] synthase family protein [Puia sp.]